jgi:glutathione S-transferase
MTITTASTTTTATPPTMSLTFYDIALAPPVEESSCSPNPWKTRYALNFKRVPYKTTWVPLPDISAVRTPLNIPPSRKFADGSPYYTLPMITDPSTNRTVGDSFEIAVYLQDQYPTSGGGDLFPPQKLDFTFERELDLFAPIAVADVGEGGHLPAYVRFNTNVDGAFTAHAQLMGGGMPLDPARAEETKKTFEERIGIPWDALILKGDGRVDILKSLEETLSGLAELYRRDASGPFLLGERATYADFIVGGWLRFCRGCLPAQEWELIKGFHDGIFGKLHEGLEAFAQMD